MSFSCPHTNERFRVRCFFFLDTRNAIGAFKGFAPLLFRMNGKGSDNDDDGVEDVKGAEPSDIIKNSYETNPSSEADDKQFRNRGKRDKVTAAGEGNTR